MALDLNKLKQRLENINNKYGNQPQNDRIPFWKTKPGTHRLRLLPESDGDPFKEVFTHFFKIRDSKSGQLVQRAAYCFKKNQNKQCPFCDFATLTYRGDGTREPTKEEKDLAKSLFANRRFQSLAIDRTAEDQIVLFTYNDTTYGKFLKYATGEEVGDITDVRDGYDIEVTVVPVQGRKAPKVDVEAVRKSSPLFKDKEKIDEMLKKVKEAEPKAIVIPTIDEVEKLLVEFVNSHATEASSIEEEKYGKKDSADDAETPQDDESASDDEVDVATAARRLLSN